MLVIAAPIMNTSTKVADDAKIVHLQEIYPKDSTFLNWFQFIPER
jgi:hypothetical protein